MNGELIFQVALSGEEEGASREAALTAMKAAVTANPCAPHLPLIRFVHLNLVPDFFHEYTCIVAFSPGLMLNALNLFNLLSPSSEAKRWGLKLKV